MGSRACSCPTDGRLASEKDRGLIFARRANRSLLSDVVSSALRRPCINHWSTTTTIADELNAARHAARTEQSRALRLPERPR
eukprot:4582916-Prymnesium_polylepis.1